MLIDIHKYKCMFLNYGNDNSGLLLSTLLLKNTSQDLRFLTIRTIVKNRENLKVILPQM